MLPLCEELEYLISSSVWKPSEVTNAIFSFRTRLRHGEYEDLSSRKNDVENGFKWDDAQILKRGRILFEKAKILWGK